MPFNYDGQTVDEGYFLSVGQMARRCFVNRRTVHRWINSNLLKAQTLPSGRFRISEQEFLKFVGEYRIPVKKTHLKTGATKVFYLDVEGDQFQKIKKFSISGHQNIDFECVTGVIESCLFLGLKQPGIILISSQLNQKTKGAIVTQARLMKEFSHAYFVLVQDSDTIAFAENMSLFDYILSCPKNDKQLIRVLDILIEESDRIPR